MERSTCIRGGYIGRILVDSDKIVIPKKKQVSGNGPSTNFDHRKLRCLIPDITLRLRIEAHEDLDRFFGIIEESFEFLFCGRLARSWDLDFLNVN